MFLCLTRRVFHILWDFSPMDVGQSEHQHQQLKMKRKFHPFFDTRRHGDFSCHSADGEACSEVIEGRLGV